MPYVQTLGLSITTVNLFILVITLYHSPGLGSQSQVNYNELLKTSVQVD